MSNVYNKGLIFIYKERDKELKKMGKSQKNVIYSAQLFKKIHEKMFDLFNEWKMELKTKRIH